MKILIPTFTFAVGLCIGLYLCLWGIEVEKSADQMTGLLEVQLHERTVPPPAKRTPVETEVLQSDPVLEGKVEISDSGESSESWLDNSTNGTLQAALEKHPAPKIKNVQSLLEGARVLERELKAAQEAAFPLFESACQESDERLLAEYRRRRAQAWSDYRTRIEQLVIQHLED